MCADSQIRYTLSLQDGGGGGGRRAWEIRKWPGGEMAKWVKWKEWVLGQRDSDGGMVAGPLRGWGVERQHMSGARVHRGDKMEGMWGDRLKL